MCGSSYRRLLAKDSPFLKVSRNGGSQFRIPCPVGQLCLWNLPDFAEEHPAREKSASGSSKCDAGEDLLSDFWR